LSLVGETWEASSGTNKSTGESCDTFQYSECGSYACSGSGNEAWSNSGSFTRSGCAEDKSEYTINSTYFLGSWQTTGNGCGSGYDHSCYSYSNTGTYTSILPHENGSNFTMCGTSSQSGCDQSSMTYQTQSTLLSDGSWLRSGSGCESGSSHEESSYDGSGTFTMTIGDPHVVGGTGYNGNANHDGCSEMTSTWNVIWSMQNDIWSRTSGTNTITDYNSTHLDFAGSANTEEDYIQGGASYLTTSSRSTNGYEDNQSQTTLSLYIVNGDWDVLSGTGTGYGASHLHHDYETSGCYSSNSSCVTGTFGSSGHETLSSTSNLQFTWNVSEWETTGTNGGR